MKKLLFLLFASLLVLGACGQKEESTSKEESTKKTESKDEKKETKKVDKTKNEEDEGKESAKKSEPKTEEQSTEEVTTEEPQSVEEDITEQPTQEQQTIEQPAQQEKQYDDGHKYHYDPEYDRYGYTGMVDEEGMPVLDPNENFDPHGGQVPNDNLTEEEIREMMD